MHDQISKLHALFDSKIGRCATCMRQSLVAALAAWGIFALGLLMWWDHLVQDLIGLSALGLTALWLLHVATYALRATALSTDEGASNIGAVSTQTKPGTDHISRRRAFGVLLRAARVGAAVSVPAVLWPSTSFAFCGQCTRNEQCGVGWVCRNTAPVNSGTVCNECVKS